MGEAGSIAKTKEGVFQQSALPILPLDTTGAGDCFNAGIVFGILRNWGILKVLRFAHALAALAISRPREDRYPALEEVEEYLDKWQ
jgi:sugar/nucleoside kinase (ribokinase family)